MNEKAIQQIIKDYLKNHLKVDVYTFQGHTEVTLRLDNEYVACGSHEEG